MLEGKLALVAGVANRRSIAWAIAQELHARERSSRSRTRASGSRSPCASWPRVDRLRHRRGQCDVRSDEDLDRAFGSRRGLGGLDLMVHSIAFAQAHDLQGRFADTARDDFWLALDISAYSLVAMASAPSR